MNEYWKDDKYVCVECGGPREPERSWPKPGITKYKPCPQCGAIGVCRDSEETHSRRHRSRRRRLSDSLGEEAAFLGGCVKPGAVGLSEDKA